MILRASDVVDLQYVLMDSARRYAQGGYVSQAVRDDLLSSAAALDYTLLLASEHGDEPFEGTAPVAASIRETMTRAANSALDFAEALLSADRETVADVLERNAREGGLFDVVRSLRATGAITSDDVGFRALTIANDLRERQAR